MLSIIALALASGAAASATPSTLAQEQAIAIAFEARFHMATLPFVAEPPSVKINSTPMLSYYDGDSVHEAQFDELPPPVQAIFDRWAGFTGDVPSGKALLKTCSTASSLCMRWGIGPLLRCCFTGKMRGVEAVSTNERNNHWQAELECNRISVAWWREKDPVYLAKLVRDFRSIVAALPNPVPPSQDMQTYFAANYEKLGRDPNVYGWFLLQSVVLAYDESPRTFQQVIDRLPTETFAR